jgi:hypothetical protein
MTTKNKTQAKQKNTIKPSAASIPHVLENAVLKGSDFFSVMVKKIKNKIIQLVWKFFLQNEIKKIKHETVLALGAFRAEYFPALLARCIDDFQQHSPPNAFPSAEKNIFHSFKEFSKRWASDPSNLA